MVFTLFWGVTNGASVQPFSVSMSGNSVHRIFASVHSGVFLQLASARDVVMKEMSQQRRAAVLDARQQPRLHGLRVSTA